MPRPPGSRHRSEYFLQCCRGPALFMDMSRFARERLSMGAIDDGDLRFQLFYSYLLVRFRLINSSTPTPPQLAQSAASYHGRPPYMDECGQPCQPDQLAAKHDHARIVS